MSAAAAAANPLLALAAAQQQANPLLMAQQAAAAAAYQQAAAIERLRQSANTATAAANSSRFSPYRVRSSPTGSSDSSNSVSSAFKTILPKASPPVNAKAKVSVTPPAAAPTAAAAAPSENSPDSQIKSMEELVNGLNGGGSSSTFGISHEISI